MLHKAQHPSPSLLTIFGKPQITQRQGKYSAEVKNTVGYYCKGHLLDYNAWLSACGHTPLNMEHYGQSSEWHLCIWLPWWWSHLLGHNFGHCHRQMKLLTVLNTKLSYNCNYFHYNHGLLSPFCCQMISNLKFAVVNKEQKTI